MSKPNELIQVDYLYVFRNIAPSVIVADKDDLSDSQQTKLKNTLREWMGELPVTHSEAG